MNIFDYKYLIYYRIVTNNSMLFEKKENLSKFNRVKGNFFCWYADPFLIDINGKMYIFAEVANKVTVKGNIAFYDFSKKKWKTIYRPSNHISFPNIFKIANTIKAIPETSELSEVSIYTIDEKNFKWEKDKILFKSNYSVDSILLYEKDNTIIASYEMDTSSNVYVLNFRKMNSDVVIYSLTDEKKFLRPAGNPFRRNGITVFPTQDCSKQYGGGIIFNSLVNDSLSFNLTQFNNISPDDIKKFIGIKNCIGCHTYNSCGNYEVIDIKVRVFSFFGLLKKILFKIFKKNGKIHL